MPLYAPVLNDMAALQHGVVTRGQLLTEGFTSNAVDGWVQAGHLLPLHRGVYLHGALIGALEPARARVTAAVLACGAGAVVSHESAASLWELLGPRPRRAPVHVTIPGADRGRRPGIHPHRVRDLPEVDVAAVDGVPLTSPARTVVDLATRLRPRTLEQAMAEAERRELAGPADIAAVLEQRPRARGAPLLRRLMAGRTSPALTRSAAEDRLLAMIRKGGLPPPATNVKVGGYEVDFFWRSAGVVVEVDGFAYHSSRRSFENDRRRDARLAASGLRVARVTWRQLTHEPDAVLVRLAQLLTLARVRPQEVRPAGESGA